MQDMTPLDKKVIEDVLDIMPQSMTTAQMTDLIYNMVGSYGMESDWQHITTLVSAAFLGLLDAEDYEDEEEGKVTHA